jgi:hypothetical protein
MDNYQSHQEDTGEHHPVFRAQDHYHMCKHYKMNCPATNVNQLNETEPQTPSSQMYQHTMMASEDMVEQIWRTFILE